MALDPRLFIPNYRPFRAAGDPVPAVSIAQNPLPLPPPRPATAAEIAADMGPTIAVRVLSGAPAARFRITDERATPENVASAEGAELAAQPDGSYAFTLPHHDASGHTLILWALGSDGRVIARLPLAITTSTWDFGADGQFHAAGLPSWVAPVAVIGGVAVVGAIIAGFVLSEKSK